MARKRTITFKDYGIEIERTYIDNRHIKVIIGHHLRNE
jgi:hypothetical protein